MFVVQVFVLAAVCQGVKPLALRMLIFRQACAYFNEGGWSVSQGIIQLSSTYSSTVNRIGIVDT